MKTGCQTQIIRSAGSSGPAADSGDAIGGHDAPDAADMYSATVKEDAGGRERGQELIGGRFCTVAGIDRERPVGLAGNGGTRLHSGSSCHSQTCAGESANSIIRKKKVRGNCTLRKKQ
ncbi:hypothetical protein [Immundisolibacter sp.]